MSVKIPPTYFEERRITLAQRLCPQCQENYFETGYGVKRKVRRVTDQVCDRCSHQSVLALVNSTIEYVEGLKRSHPDLNWQPLLDKAYRSKRRYQAWEARFGEQPERVKGYLRACAEDSTIIQREAMRFLIDQRLRMAKNELARIGRVKVPINTSDPAAIRRLEQRQARLDQLRERVERGIKIVESNLAQLDTRGAVSGAGWWNLLRDTVSTALQTYFRVLSYKDGQDRVEAYKIEHALRLATTPSVAEEEGASYGQQLEPDTAQPFEEPSEDQPTQSLIGSVPDEFISEEGRKKSARKKAESK